MRIREAVRVRMDMKEIDGVLFVSNGFPRLFTEEFGCYGLTTFPAAWSLSSPTCGPLYTAWRDIEEIMEQLKVAEREAENEAKERCEVEQYKASADAEGTR